MKTLLTREPDSILTRKIDLEDRSGTCDTLHLSKSRVVPGIETDLLHYPEIYLQSLPRREERGPSRDIGPLNVISLMLLLCIPGCFLPGSGDRIAIDSQVTGGVTGEDEGR